MSYKVGNNLALRDKIFQEDHMYNRILRYIDEEHYVETAKALPYMMKEHASQTRKHNWFSENDIPYVIHPLMMACHAHALGVRNDEVIAAILLHDVCEDCGVKPEELPVNDKVREIVRLLTYQPKDELTEEENLKAYYSAIAESRSASMVKIIDRCNNISGMAASFDREKLIEYIRETEIYVLPLMDTIKFTYTEYNDAVFIVKYHILSVLESLKNMILREESSETHY